MKKIGEKVLDFIVVNSKYYRLIKCIAIIAAIILLRIFL